MPDILVADIGGTNARIAVARAAVPDLVARKTVPTASIDDLGAHLSAFLYQTGARPARAVLAVAAPIDGDEIALTNAQMRFSTHAVERAIGAPVVVINDFQAMARGAAHSGASLSVKSGAPVVDAPRAVLGPGTGLGLSLLHERGADVRVVATQGGHAAFAPQSDDERRVLIALQERRPFVSYEDVVSGPGLSRIFATFNGKEVRPRDITERALNGDGESLAVFSVFFSALGTFAADAALMTGARGGVILAGGILPRVAALLLRSSFAERFVARPAMHDYLADIPVSLLTDPDAALIGAALWRD